MLYKNAFWNRVELFDQLAPFLQDKKVIIAGGHWDRLKHHDQLSRFIRSDLLRHYRPRYDIETFNGASDLRSKIDYYLQHEEEHLAIAWHSLWMTW